MKKTLSVIMCLVLMLIALTGCGKVQEESTTIRIGAMSGPTAMGMVRLMKDAEDGNTVNSYDFAELATDASAFVPALATGELDIAAVPSNLASTIYNNTDGQVKVLAVCVLGVLNLVERGDSVNSIADLKGKDIYATGQGAVPEYTIRYLLNANGLDIESDVNMIWCADTTEALSYLSSVEGAIAVLPQPFATAAAAQVEDLRIAMDLNDAWDETGADCEIVTGVIVARKEFVDNYPNQLKQFMEEYAKSVSATYDNIDETAELIAQYGIVPKAPLAKKALPGCHIVNITGSELKNTLEGFLNVIYEMNPKAVGGALPSADFYYGI